MVGVVVALVVAVVAGVLYRWRNGRLRDTPAAGVPAPSGPAGAAVAATALRAELLRDLGVELGSRATLLQFSSAFCAPCRGTRTLLSAIAARDPGVRHIEVDAESHLDAVRELGVRRTPTVLILDRTGRAVQRGSGLPRRDDVLAALSRLDDQPDAPLPSPPSWS